MSHAVAVATAYRTRSLLGSRLCHRITFTVRLPGGPIRRVPETQAMRGHPSEEMLDLRRSSSSALPLAILLHSLRDSRKGGRP